jgi:hypothetical protein
MGSLYCGICRESGGNAAACGICLVWQMFAIFGGWSWTE